MDFDCIDNKLKYSSLKKSKRLNPKIDTTAFHFTHPLQTNEKLF